MSKATSGHLHRKCRGEWYVCFVLAPVVPSWGHLQGCSSEKRLFCVAGHCTNKIRDSLLYAIGWWWGISALAGARPSKLLFRERYLADYPGYLVPPTKLQKCCKHLLPSHLPTCCSRQVADAGIGIKKTLSSSSTAGAFTILHIDSRVEPITIPRKRLSDHPASNLFTCNVLYIVQLLVPRKCVGSQLWIVNYVQ